MSLLMSEFPELVGPPRRVQAATTTRQVDTATRLHAWSIPMPRCIHGLLFDQHCEQCEIVAPLETAARPAWK
jgi:hypothetical protein